MARERQNEQTSGDAVISIIAPGMTVVGNCESDGTVRVEGTVRGSIKAGNRVAIKPSAIKIAAERMASRDENIDFT